MRNVFNILSTFALVHCGLAHAQTNPIDIEVMVENHERNGVGFPNGIFTPAAERIHLPQDDVMKGRISRVELNGRIATLHFGEPLTLKVQDATNVHDLRFPRLLLQLDDLGLKYLKWIGEWTATDKLLQTTHQWRLDDFMEGRRNSGVGDDQRPRIYSIVRKIEITANYADLISEKPISVRVHPNFIAQGETKAAVLPDLDRQNYSDFSVIDLKDPEELKIAQAIARADEAARAARPRRIPAPESSGPDELANRNLLADPDLPVHHLCEKYLDRND